MRLLTTLLAACGAALIVAACGGGSDGAAPASASTTVSGSVVKGPVNGATVNFYEVTSTGAKGRLLGTTTTGAGGSYSATVGHAGAILLEVTGGSYTDEATGATKTLSETMRLMVDSGAGGGPINGVVTPLTTIAYSLALNGGSTATAATYKAAVTSIATQFNLSSPSVSFVATVPNVSSGTTHDYGKALRAISQYVANGGSLATFLAWNNPSSFNSAFATAWQTANGGGTVTFAFNDTGVTIGGTGAGGGSGTCGVRVQGTISPGSGLPSMPLDLNFCVQGVVASCDAGNASISSGLAGNGALAGAANLNYTYSSSCAPGATTITLN